MSSLAATHESQADLAVPRRARTADPDRAVALAAWRTQAGSVPGPFEAWLAHRSLATLEVRLERQCATALALAERLVYRDDVTGVQPPMFVAVTRTRSVLPTSADLSK